MRKLALFGILVFQIQAFGIGLVEIKDLVNRPLEYDSAKCAVKLNQYGSLNQMVVTKPGESDPYAYVSANSRFVDGEMVASDCFTVEENESNIFCFHKTNGDVEGDPRTAKCYSYVVNIKKVYHANQTPRYTYHLINAVAYSSRGYCDNGTPVQPEGRARVTLECSNL